jgi:hypothetical protein
LAYMYWKETGDVSVWKALHKDVDYEYWRFVCWSKNR